MSGATVHELFVAEPPAMYLVRPAVVADCSVLAALLFSEAQRTQAERQLSGKALHAPFLLDTEFASVALKKSAAGLSPELIDVALSAYASQQIDYHRPDMRAQCALAARYRLSAYDAAYLWLAAELRAPLATFDRQLATAARTHLGTLQ